MRTPALARVALAAAVAASSGAWARDADPFRASLDPEGFHRLSSSRTGPAGRYHLAVTGEGLRAVDASEIRTLRRAEFSASFTVARGLELGLAVPVSDATVRDPSVDSGFGVDDVRSTIRWTVVDDRTESYGFALEGTVEAPTGSASRPNANGDWDGGLAAVLDWRRRTARAALGAGVWSSGRPFDGEDLDDALTFGAAVGGVPFPDLGPWWNWRATELFVEVSGRAAARRPFKKKEETPVELWGGFRFWLPNGAFVRVGAGTGLIEAPGAATVRGGVTLGWMPPPAPPPPLPVVPAGPPGDDDLVETDEEVLPLSPIVFDEGSAILPLSASRELPKVAAWLERHPDELVRVTSHADDAELAAQRAEVVREALVLLGVDATRIETRGHGPERPIVPREAPAASSRNQRTELHVLP